MGSLRLEKIDKAFGATKVLHSIDLEVHDGEFVVFVGPSGCGKSTLLRIIAGLEDATAGNILIDDEPVNVVPPAKRGISMVFQTYALYPHLTVRGNMGLGLKQIGTPADKIAERIETSANMLSLGPYLDRRPSELSGGQRQRVAIGRALVRSPKLFLFDEPLSNLDAALRVNTRIEIAKLHHQLQATMVYVTHDQIEAMTLANRIVVLNAGRIEQIGTPMELYNAPANQFVAGFIGSPQMNFVDAERVGISGPKTIGVRPEHISLSPESGAWKGTVAHAELLGADTNIYLETENAGAITVRLFGEHHHEVGETLYATPEEPRTFHFDADGKVLPRG